MARVYVTGDLAAFISAFEANLSDVIRGMGLTGTVSASYSSLGREVILKINAPHIHMWSTEWTGNGTHHWHACIGEGLCNITSDSDKNGYAAHLFDREVADEIYRVAGTVSSYYKSCICGTHSTNTARSGSVTRARTGTNAGSAMRRRMRRRTRLNGRSIGSRPRPRKVPGMRNVGFAATKKAPLPSGALLPPLWREREAPGVRAEKRG